MSKYWPIIVPVVYFTVACLTWAISYERKADWRQHEREATSLFAAVVWPLYLGGIASLAIVQSFNSKECVSVTNTTMSR